MKPEEKQAFEQLQQRVAELERYVSERKRQQISKPLDEASIAVLNEHFMRITADATYTNHTGRVFVNYLGTQGGRKFMVTENTLFRYRVDPDDDTVHVENNPFSADMRVYFYAGPEPGDAAPGGIAADGTTYGIKDVSGDSFKLYLWSDGTKATINITNVGTGPQFIGYY